MAFQLGALNTPRTELVKQDPYKSGSYSNLFSKMNRNQEALGQREDRATLNALGSARAEAIMDGQAGSSAIQDLRAKQQEALAKKNIGLYDDLTAQLQSQMQVEAQEARVDPLGKTQMARDKSARDALYRQQQLDAKNNANLGTPKIAENRFTN